MHPRPRLSLYGRFVLVTRVRDEGWSVAAAAKASGVSRATGHKWVRRHNEEGVDGLRDRPSRPRSSLRQLEPEQEAEILSLRRELKLGPHRLAARTGRPRSTCYKVLQRYGLHRLDWLDRPTGRLIRRYEYQAPGELVHVDVKKLSRIPPGGGHRVHGREVRRHRKRGSGYDFVHSMVDDHSRFAYSEVQPDEQGATCAGFLRRAGQFFADHGIEIERVMTDNAFAYCHSRDFQAVLREMGARHRRIPPYRPQVNGKVERFNRTLLEEWGYVRPYDGNEERVALLGDWLHGYNYHRAHTSLAGLPPASRVNDVCGNYS
jgi:transposase InsO family protein